MKNRFLHLLLLGGALVGCEKDPVENLAPPTILSFRAEADTVGAVVRLVGTQFSKKPENNFVSFAGQETPAFAVRGDTLHVRVPKGAMTGLLTLRVYDQRTVSATPFTVLTGHWKLKGTMPANRRYVEGFAWNGLAYLRAVGAGTAFWSYAPLTHRWTQQADFPGGPRGGALSFVVGNVGYVGGGLGSPGGFSTSLTDFYAYDAVDNRWTRIADIFTKVPGFGSPEMSAERAVAFALNGKGYLVCPDYEQRQVWEYTPQTNSWKRKADFPGVPRYMAAGMAIGSKGYIGGGTIGRPPYLREFWEYDPIPDTWRRRADLPTGGEGTTPVAFALGEKGYFGLGDGDRFFEYDPQQDTWTRKANLPGISAYPYPSFTAANKGYIVSLQALRTQTDELWEFTP